ncbi:MAG: hypothetical protein R3302_08705 [Sulfurimonadaceae bacterium]|nr:hypothetical protein [Sulfurimonadaceae bacterium]
MELTKICQADGSWTEMSRQWEETCVRFGENLEDYASASLPVLKELAFGADMANSGVFSHIKDGQHKAICQVNRTFLPGYDGQVLRVRHIVFAPEFDFQEDIDLGDYASVLVGVFVGSVMLADNSMPSKHIKFHLKSPAERSFGNLFVDSLKEHTAFKEVNLKGSWIYLSKA